MDTPRRGAAWVYALPALLGAGALAVSVHLILFRRTALVSSSPVPWVGAAAALFIAAVVSAHRCPDETQLGPWPGRARLGRPETAMVLLFFVLLLGFSLSFERATADGREYFAQARSVVIDGDLDFRNEIERFRTHGVTWVMPPGTAVAWLPFFAAAHVWIMLMGAAGLEVSPDGFWNPYQQAVGLGTLLLGWIGLVLLYRLLRRYYSEWTSVACTWAFTLGTFVLYYLTVEATYAHGVALFAVMLFITLFLAQGTERTTRRMFVLGLAAGFMISVRWENAAFLLLPLVRDAGQVSRDLFRGRWRLLVPYAAAAVGAVIAFLPQLLIWSTYQGRILTVPEMAGEQWWGEALPLEVLFSSDRGLMAWHPLFFFGAVGLPLAWQRDRRFVATMTVIVAALVYVNGASAWLAGGAGFGYRRLMVAVPAFALGLAALLEFLVPRPRLVLAAVLAAFVSLNLAVVGEVVGGRLPVGEGTTFDDLFGSLYRRTGNPFAAPATAWYWLRYGMGPTQYDQLGRQSFRNVVIEVGTDADRRFLVRGWGGDERDPLGTTFRWVVGERASFVVPLKERTEVGARHALPGYTLKLSIEPFRTPDARQQYVSVLVNGTTVTQDRPLHGGLRDVSVTVPAAHLRRWFNFFELRFAWAASPRSLGLSGDDRSLSARLTRISLQRNEP